MLNKLKQVLLGKPINPMDKATRGHISLIAFFAWIGLGADGLSSVSYGPEQAFLALGHNAFLGLYLAGMIAITVFVISIAYNQVIELFPSGGGGYKVATRLIGRFPGLISGSALILGYVLTITMSIAAGVAALFSLLPIGMQHYKLMADVCAILLLMYLNMRGMKESIKVFLPIFMGFIVAHVFIIAYGIGVHVNNLPIVYHRTVQDAHHVTSLFGWAFLMALLLRAYSLGGGTYTGLEAVSNNVNNLAEPRIKTGKWTMLYMAISLSFTAAGILLLYLLWNVHPVFGQTLNAVAFAKILHNFPMEHLWLIFILATEAGLLFLGANTGFLGGSAVLANMAIDGWVPRRFGNLSNRLVVQNGIVLFGFLSLIVLLGTDGSITELIILYSTSVFITFSMSLFGLTIYWARKRKRAAKNWIMRLLLSIFGLIICLFILVTIIASKFTSGGWMTILINGIVIGLCLMISRHYKATKKQVKSLDKMFTFPIEPLKGPLPKLNPMEPTAVFFVGDSIGMGMHTLLWAQRMFPNHFKNFVFITVGIVDVNTYESDKALKSMQRKVKKRMKYFTDYSHAHEIPTKTYVDYGTDHVNQLVDMANQAKDDFGSPVFFSARMVLEQENWITRQLHNETPIALQRSLHMHDMQMIIFPVTIGRNRKRKK